MAHDWSIETYRRKFMVTVVNGGSLFSSNCHFLLRQLETMGHSTLHSAEPQLSNEHTKLFLSGIQSGGYFVKKTVFLTVFLRPGKAANTWIHATWLAQIQKFLIHTASPHTDALSKNLQNQHIVGKYILLFPFAC